MKKCFIIAILFGILTCLFGCGQKYYNEWVEKGEEKYYYDESGRTVKSCIKLIGRYWYAFDEKGCLVINKVVNFGGKSYITDAAGLLEKNGWYKCNGNWYYLKKYLLQSGWVEDEGSWYYLNPSTYILCKNQWIDTNYYVNDKGKMCQEVMLNIDGKDYYFDKNGKCIENYIQISNFINKFILNLSKGGNHTFTLSNLDVITSSDGDVRFMYIVGDDRFTNGIKSYYEDYVKGSIINNEFVRNLQPVYDSMDNNVLEKMQDWKRMSALYADKCNNQTSMEEYMNGKRDGCGKGLSLVSDDAIALSSNLSRSEYPEMYSIITNQYPQGRTVTTESGCDEMISIKNTLRRWGIG